MHMNFRDLIKPDRTVTLTMEVYDETAMNVLKDGTKNRTVQITLNKPTIADDEHLSEFVKGKYSTMQYHQEAVRLLLPAEEGHEYTAEEIDSLIMQTGGHQREDSLPNRALSLFGRYNPEQRKIIEQVIAGRMTEEQAQEELAPNPVEQEQLDQAEPEGLGTEDPNT